MVEKATVAGYPPSSSMEMFQVITRLSLLPAAMGVKLLEEARNNIRTASHPLASPGIPFDSIKVGDACELVRRITKDDVRRFAEVTGDWNPLHFDPVCARAAGFDGPIVHGKLYAGFLITLLGMEFPGAGSILASESLRYRAPVYIGSTVTTRISVSEKDPSKRKVIFFGTCAVGERTVLESTITVIPLS